MFIPCDQVMSYTIKHLATLQVVDMTTCYAISDNKVGIMTMPFSVRSINFDVWNSKIVTPHLQMVKYLLCGVIFSSKYLWMKIFISKYLLIYLWKSTMFSAD